MWLPDCRLSMAEMSSVTTKSVTTTSSQSSIQRKPLPNRDCKCVQPQGSCYSFRSLPQVPHDRVDPRTFWPGFLRMYVDGTRLSRSTETTCDWPSFMQVPDSGVIFTACTLRRIAPLHKPAPWLTPTSSLAPTPSVPIAPPPRPPRGEREEVQLILDSRASSPLSTPPLMSGA